MIDRLMLATSSGIFCVHHFQGTSERLLVFVPGFMEPKDGLFYVWNEMACYFHHQGHSCLLFDLAGQGDSLLPLSFDIWIQQRNAILTQFSTYKIHFIARGLGTVLLTADQIHIAINPSLFEPVARQFNLVRWKSSPDRTDFLTLAEPRLLLESEKECFCHLGAEIEWIEKIQLPANFVRELPQRLPLQLTDNIYSYETGDYPFLERRSRRDTLRRLIENDLVIKAV